VGVDSAVNNSLGYVDVKELLERCRGDVEITLTDLGATCKLERRYQWTVNGDFTEIRPIDDLSKKLKLPTRIYLTPRIVAFIGLYDGDGNKARNGGREIGFSQREINIHKFASDMFKEIFGSQFETKWSILEDTRRFETDEIRQELDRLRSQMIARNPAESPELDALKKEYIRREFLEAARKVGLNVNESQIRTPVVSSKKGAKAAGKSSLEYIQNLSGSGKFLTIWLKIVRICTDNIISNKPCAEGLVFSGEPHESGIHILDVGSYTRSLKWATGKRTAKYIVENAGNGFVEIAKSKKVRIRISSRLKLTPFLFLVAGIYLAEGDTKKDNFFTFETTPASLNVALTSSEPEYIGAFIRLLEILGKNLLKSWKVKVGTKYEWETEELAQRFGVISLRAGEKGQGYVRTLELDRELQNWGLTNHPTLRNYSELYHHMEITGVGIPRAHIQAAIQIAPYFISLIRDCVFDFPNILKHVTSGEQI
jgi:hypothetical protein